MKAEDTVMNRTRSNKLTDIIYKDNKIFNDEVVPFLKAQAEISFKAGIKEVIEWIKKHELTSPDDNSITRFYPFYYIEERELKEWGIE